MHHAKVVSNARIQKITAERILIPLCLRENLGENYFGANKDAKYWVKFEVVHCSALTKKRGLDSDESDYS